MLERIPTVLDPQEILDKGFAKAAKIDLYDPVKYHRIRKTETARLASAIDTISTTLARYPAAFPNLDRLRDYNVELLDILVGLPELRKALGSIKWGAEKVTRIGQEARQKIDQVRKRDGVDPFFQARKWAYGRVSSIVKELGGALALVAMTRDMVRVLPTVSPDYATIVIAGYPNVGKTSLLRAWTGSRAAIDQYAFTTKRAEVGHFEREDAQEVVTKYQVVDTPGLLDRPDEDRNDIERQALVAVRHAADAVLFIIDPTEMCGYDREAQEHLLSQTQAEMMGVPMIVAHSKLDMLDDAARADLPEGRMAFSTKTEEGLPALQDAIVATFRNEDDLELEEDPLLKWRKPAADEW